MASLFAASNSAPTASHREAHRGRGRSQCPCHVQRASNVRMRRSLVVEAIAEVSLQAKEATKLSNLDRITILSEALPYLQRFRGKTIVVKYGGAAMKDSSLKQGVITDIVLLSCVGIRTVLVHGGGPEINLWLDKVGIKAEFKNGLRVTDAATMEIVEMVLGGRVNKSLVSLIQQAGGQAMGLSGKDGGLLTARQMIEKDIGFVGEVTRVDPSILKMAVDKGYTPVVATIATDERGQALNINADTAAGEIAAALQAEKLVLMTDVPGVLRDKNDITTKLHTLDIRSCRTLIQEGVIAGGMIPKIDCCIRSLAQGVGAAHIIDGRAKHSILMELLTDEGVGTMITG
ncbi:acetylglutamate kinase [Haematococcus lacustris]